MHQRVAAKFRIVAIIEGGGKKEPAVPPTADELQLTRVGDTGWSYEQ